MSRKKFCMYKLTLCSILVSYLCFSSCIVFWYLFDLQEEVTLRGSLSLLHCCIHCSLSIKEIHGEAWLFFQKHVHRDSGTSLLTLSLEYAQEAFMHGLLLPLLAWHFLSSGHCKYLCSYPLCTKLLCVWASSGDWSVQMVAHFLTLQEHAALFAFPFLLISQKCITMLRKPGITALLPGHHGKSASED